MKLIGRSTDIVTCSDRLVDDLVPPPAEGAGICQRCRTWNDSSPGQECSNCQEIRCNLHTDPLPLDVISLYQKPSNLRDWLTRYKGRPGDPDDPHVPEYEPIIEALIGRYIYEHGDRLESRSGNIDCIAVVPSASRTSPHPLEAVLRRLPLDVPVRSLLQRGPGELGFRKPAIDGYKPTTDHFSNGPQRVILVDDVYTTGARINSASSALTAAGHTVVGALVAARRVNPGYSERAREFWDHQASQSFDWKTGPIVARWP